MARVFIIGLLLFALIAGAGLYYLQVYAYYTEVAADIEEVKFTDAETGSASPVMFEKFKGIDSDSSPLRYRACYEIPQPRDELATEFTVLDRAEPRVAPRWFDCFDAEQIGADLDAGVALAFLGEQDVTYGIDRIVAVYPDGRAYAWHDINRCGEVVFDGNPAPADCPPPPEGSN